MRTTQSLNWHELGKALRASAADAHGAVEGVDFPPIDIAYEFLLENPECFLEGDDPEWPEDMPQDAPSELIAAYYGTI